MPIKEDLLLAHLNRGQLKLDYLDFVTAYLGHGGSFDHVFVLFDNLDELDLFLDEFFLPELDLPVVLFLM